MKIISKRVSFLVFVGILLVTMGSVVYAGTVGTYFFEISTRVEGTKTYNLENKSTHTVVRAETYSYYPNYPDTVVSYQKQKYLVTFNKKWSFSAYSTGELLADGGASKTISLGMVNEGTYNVSVNKTTGDAALNCIIGSGRIEQ